MKDFFLTTCDIVSMFHSIQVSLPAKFGSLSKCSTSAQRMTARHKVGGTWKVEMFCIIQSVVNNGCN